MDRARPVEELPADPLGDEIRHSALLLVGALGSMSLVAVVLLVLTTRYGGAG